MKIAIIGAGPGGLYAALSAIKQNIQVDLFEKSKVGEGIVCGECIFDSLGIMAQPGKGLLHPVTEIVFKGRRDYTFPSSRYRKLWMLDRRSWQQELASQAQSLGVVIFENTKITPTRLLQMQKEYDWILDASGAPSTTSRAYQFADDYFKEYLLAYQLVLAGNFSTLMPRIKIIFSPNIPACLQPAYYWIFPKDAGQANAGVVCTVRGTLDKDQLDLKKMLADILYEECLSDATVIEKGGGIALTRMLPHLIYDNILLVGDAAGLTSPLHGGGIDMACLSGVLAVGAISCGREGVAAYEKKLQRYLFEKIALERFIIRKMRTMSFDQFDNLLSGVTSKSRLIRLKTALCHPYLLYLTIKWLGKKKERPAWPV
ncbi:MAG: NAD(P)/FAD-dependent oxidoreductase [Syntrophaceae bacterium]|nr:NAD(P)/FAD-dependent oxidoreductase [Syntrophaceae bacterium]